MTVSLTTAAKKLLDAPEYAAIATLEPDGSPQLSVVWLRRDGDDVLVSTVEGRRKHRNLVRDARATIIVWPHRNPGCYLEVRGRATLSRVGGRELIEELSRKYTSDDRYAFDDGTDNVRVVVRITPVRVVEYSLG